MIFYKVGEDKELKEGTKKTWGNWTVKWIKLDLEEAASFSRKLFIYLRCIGIWTNNNRFTHGLAS